MATIGNGLWKRAVRVPMCMLREANARIRKILHRPRTKKSETERTVNELDESVARPHSRHESEIEVVREEEDELLEKAIMDDATINALIDEQKYTSEQIRYLKEDNESTHKELTRATDAVIELRECNKKLLNDLHQLERKCLEQEVQLNDLRVAATSTFAGKAAAAKSIKVAVATVARPSTAARPFTDVRSFTKARPSTAAAAFPAVNRTAPLQSISKNRAIDRSRKKPECVSNLRLQVNNNYVSMFLYVSYTLLPTSFLVQLILKHCVFLTYKYLIQ